MSGEVIAAIEDEDFEGKILNFKSLKLLLAHKTGSSRFCQRLLSFDGLELSDDSMIWPQLRTLQVVSLQFRPPDANLKQQLLAACTANDFDIVEELLSQPLNPNLSDEISNWTALHFAAWNGSSESVLLLLEAKAYVDKAASGSVGAGVAPIHLAAERGHAEVVSWLLDAGANKDRKADDGSTPLILASRYGHAKAVRLLLKVGSHIERATTCGATALIFAVQHNHEEVVRLLLESGANKNNASGDAGLSPQHVAAVCGHFEVARLLHR